MSDSHAPAVSVVIPAYRSPGTLEQLVLQLDQHVVPLVDDLEVIIVDDGSGDETWATIQRLAAEHSHVRGMTLLRNYGQHNALLAGVRSAKHPIIVTMDDDGQNPPSEVPRLLECLEPHLDLVYGTPKREQQTALRNAVSVSAKWAMSKALGPDVYPRASAFRVFRRSLLAASAGVDNPSISIDVLLSWATVRISNVDVDFDARASGVSGYSFRSLIRHALNMITGYSTRPLRWVSTVGLIFASIGFVLLIYVVGLFLLGDTEVAGFTFVAGAVTMFSGVQLVSLGVLGEYLSRIHFRTMGKPPYAIRSTTDEPDHR